MKMRLMRFLYNIVQVAGRKLYTAITLSRAPTVDVRVDDVNNLAKDVHAFIKIVVQGLPAKDARI